jgi:hypothetical protein
MSAHKLAARSTACVFLGYPSSHKGYRRLDLSSRRIIISRHIVFDESIFPFTSTDPITDTSTSDSLLDVDEDTVHCSTNPAAIHSHGHPPVSVVAPPPRRQATAPYVDHSGCCSIHSGRGAATISNIDCYATRLWPCAPVPPPVAPQDAAGLVPSLPHFYTRRPAAPASSTATSTITTSPPASTPADPPAAARPMTRTQTGTGTYDPYTDHTLRSTRLSSANLA